MFGNEIFFINLRKRFFKYISNELKLDHITPFCPPPTFLILKINFLDPQINSLK